MKVAVILSEAKDLQFRSEAHSCRFFASLRMTGFRESEARNLALSIFNALRDSSSPAAPENRSMDLIPAKAGIHWAEKWTPAFAGATPLIFIASGGP